MRIKNATRWKLAGVSVLATGLVVGLAPQAEATGIYQDDFSGDGSSNLAGTTPDTTTGSNIWTASTDWKNNGAAAGSGDDNAFLAFTPSTGNVYTLSASLATPSGGDASHWAAIGFTDTSTLGIDFWQNTASPWVLYRQNTQVVSFDGPGVSGTSAGEGNFSGPISYSIVLDTTTPSDWTAQWFVNGSEVRAAESIGTPTINYVGLGRISGVDSDFSSFSLTGVAGGQTIADYDFSGGSGASNDSDLNSSAGAFSKGAGIGTEGAISSGTETAFTRSSGTTNSEAGAISDDDYWSFTVTPDALHEFDLAQLAFNTQHNPLVGSGAADPGGNMNFFVRSSVDGFASNIGSTFAEDWNGSTNHLVDLSGDSFQNVDTAIEFRIYIYDDGNNDFQEGARLDNVVLTGDVVLIPEPGSLALLGLGGLLIARRRR